MSNSLRIALVSAFPPGMQSLNEYGFHMANALADDPRVGEVIIIADKLDILKDELLLHEKISVYRVWRFNSLGTIGAILSCLRKIRPDGTIYNLQTATFGDREIPAALGLMMPMIGRLMGFKSGIIAHNIIAGIDLETTLLKGQKLRQMLVKAGGFVVLRAMCSAHYMTVTLQSYYDYLKEKFPRANVAHIPHGTFDTQKRTHIPLSKRSQRIVTMGKFGTYKKLETLLDAFDILRSKPAYSNYQLVIGGSDHPNALGYMDQIAKDRINDKGIVFQGYIAENDIPSFFTQARLSVFDYESTTGSSGVLHQTASYGAVPVFPNIGDFIDVSKSEGLVGYNYLPNDAASMANAMMVALDNLTKANTIAKNNQRAALNMPLSEIVDFHIKQIL